MISQKFYLNKSFDVSKIEWDSYQPDKLSELQAEVIKMNTAVEYAALPASLSILKNIPETDQDLRSSIIKWAYDENKHAYVLNEYSRKFIPEGLITPYEFEQVGIDFSDSQVSIAGALTLHMCTELSTIRWYKKMITWHTEPLIKSIYEQLIVDESNHANMFKKFLILYCNKTNIKEVLTIFQLFLTKSYFISIKMASTTTIDKQSIYSRLPNPKLFDYFLNDVLRYDNIDQSKLHCSLLKIASEISGTHFNNVSDLKSYRKSL
jgi:rubrerythrin